MSLKYTNSPWNKIGREWCDVERFISRRSLHISQWRGGGLVPRPHHWQAPPPKKSNSGWHGPKGQRDFETLFGAPKLLPRPQSKLLPQYCLQRKCLANPKFHQKSSANHCLFSINAPPPRAALYQLIPVPTCFVTVTLIHSSLGKTLHCLLLCQRVDRIFWFRTRHKELTLMPPRPRLSKTHLRPHVWGVQCKQLTPPPRGQQTMLGVIPPGKIINNNCLR